MGRWGALALSSLLVVGCDDGDTEDAGAADAGGSDAGAVDGGPPLDDAGAPDAGPGAPPGTVIAEGVCDSPDAVDVAADGARYAYVTCSGDVAVWVVDHPGGAPVRVGDASADASVRLSPDGAWVLFGPTDALQIRDAAITAPAVAVAAGDVDEARFVLANVGTATELRLLILETEGATRRVTSRTEADGFAAARTLHEDATLGPSLSLVSGSGRTLVFETGAAGSRAYRSVATDGLSASALLPVDPDALALGPVGMGDTHTIGRPGDGLSFVELATGVATPLEADGVHPTAPIYAVADGVGDRYAIYLRNGDLTSTLRNGTGAPRTHVTANATDLWLSEDASRLVFVSEGRARAAAVFADADVDLAPYGSAVLDGALSADGAEVALIDGGALLVAATDGASMSVLDASGVATDSARFRGAPSPELLWLNAARDGLSRVLRARTGDATLAWDVDAYWVIPGASELLYRDTSGALRVL